MQCVEAGFGHNSVVFAHVGIRILHFRGRHSHTQFHERRRFVGDFRKLRPPSRFVSPARRKPLGAHRQSQRFYAQCQPRVRSMPGRRTDEIRPCVHGLELRRNLQRAADVRHRTQHHRPPPDEIGLLPLRPQFFQYPVLHLFLVYAIGYQPDVRAEDIVKELISLDTHQASLIVPVHQYALHPQFRGRSSRLPRVVRLGGRTRHHGRSPLRQRVSQGEIELARLVPSECQTCQIISLHHHPHLTSQRFRETRTIVQRRGKFGQRRPWKPFDGSL